MSSPLIQSNAFYRVSSNSYGPSFVLSDSPSFVLSNDLKLDAPGTLCLTQCSFSSNNWQIFYQDPIYLIRNFEYGAKYQLGIAEDSPTQPALLLASGDWTQQWNITLWDDGTFRLANVWLGGAQVLGISNKDDIPVPVMTAAQNGSHWSFSINLSNSTSNMADDMLQSVSLQAAPSSTSTSLSTSASTTVVSTPAEKTVVATTIAAGSVSSRSSSASSQATTPSSIRIGAIAGIVVTIVALALVVSGLLFFVWGRRRQRQHGLPADQAALMQHQENWHTTRHEADTRHPPSETGVPDENEGMRNRAVEMAG